MSFDLRLFRTYSASDPACGVARDLIGNYAPYVVFRRDLGAETFWYAFAVDESLLSILQHCAAFDQTVELALRLHEYDGKEYTVAGPRPGRDLLLPVDKPAHRPHVIVDPAGTVRAVLDKPVLPERIERLFPDLRCADGNSVAPDQEVLIELRLTPLPEAGVATPLDIHFPHDVPQIELHADVSSTDFSKPPGETWFQTFAVSRDLTCKPDAWAFRARAVGERPRYTLTLQFSAAGTAVGSVSLTLARDGRADVPTRVVTKGLALPAQNGARLVVSVTERVGSGPEFHLYRDGTRYAAPVGANGQLGMFFDELASAKSTSDVVQRIGWGLAIDLPQELQQMLAEHPNERTLFISDAPVAPFELLQLHPRRNGPLLGVDRAVTRCVADEAREPTVLRVRRTGCIRPTYQGADALPSAEKEERLLETLAGSALLKVTNRATFAGLLASTDIDLVHFAGHADGNPAFLSLEDHERLDATSFHPSSALLRDRRPFFFANGCRTARGTTAAPSAIANFPKAMLKSGFLGVLAAAIYVDSQAALAAAETFYEAIESLPVDEAVQRIRCRAFEDPPKTDPASMLSYVVFGSPKMELRMR